VVVARGAAAARRPETWQVFSAIGARLLGMGHLPEQAIDDFVFRQFAGSRSRRTLGGLTVDEILAKVDGEIGPPRIIDMLLRIGPHGDGFGRRPADSRSRRCRSRRTASTWAARAGASPR
jgi:hypothetical protein